MIAQEALTFLYLDVVEALRIQQPSRNFSPSNILGRPDLFILVKRTVHSGTSPQSQ
jgi:hypothetical protein